MQQSCRLDCSKQDLVMAVQQKCSAQDTAGAHAPHGDPVCQAICSTHPKRKETALEKALSSMKVELTLKQTEALLDLQCSFDRKCVEMQQKHSSELQSLKVQLTAALAQQPLQTAACDVLARTEVHSCNSAMHVTQDPASMPWSRTKNVSGPTRPSIPWKDLVVSNSDKPATTVLPSENGTSHRYVHVVDVTNANGMHNLPNTRCFVFSNLSNADGLVATDCAADRNQVCLPL